MVLSSNLTAQHSFNAQIVDHDSNEPLTGVTVYFPMLEIGGTSNSNGMVLVNNIPVGLHNITVSYVGYETILLQLYFPQSLQEVDRIIKMHHAYDELDEIIVNSTRSSRTIEDNPTRLEFIAGEELSEKGNMKPGDIRMLLNESTGIQTQQTSATSYNSSIRMQGLDGKYTQLLRDGFPLYSGFSSGLSLIQIAPLDLKQVEVIKGASSTLYGGGAIAGLVNLISKNPVDTPELSFMINQTSALGFDVSAYYSQKNEKFGTTLFTSYNKGAAYDPAGNGLTAIPEFNRITFNPKIYGYFENTTLNLGLNLVVEDRLGGSMDYIEGNRKNGLYFERNETERISSQFYLRHRFSEHIKLTLKNSSSLYDRRISVSDYTFSGVQVSTFSEVNLTAIIEQIELIGGINLWSDQFEQLNGIRSTPLDFRYTTFGGFVQNILPITSKSTLETGFRLDYQDSYGFFPLPRFSFMFEPSEKLTLRLGGGLGYMIPSVFSEEAERRQFQDIEPLNPDELNAERSLGGNLDINYRVRFTDRLSLSTNILFFMTQISDPLILSQETPVIQYIQPNGFIDTEGVELNMKWSFSDLKLFVGYTYAKVEQNNDGTVSEYPLVAKHRLNNVLMYEKHGNFWIGLEAYYFSPQNLSDGSVGQSYWITGLMTEKRINEHFSIFLNFENFLDTRQSTFDSIYSGTLENPRFSEIYAPVDGFVINGGFKINR